MKTCRVNVFNYLYMTNFRFCRMIIEHLLGNINYFMSMKACLMCFFLFLYISPYSKAQITNKIKRERKQLIRKQLPADNQLIFMDNVPISIEKFLNIPQDSIANIYPYRDDKNVNSNKYESIHIFTHHYTDSVSIANRKGLIASYRENEMQCFYGNNEPLILFGDRKISRNEYYELAEDTVAFVNFYFSDFVKSYYGPEAKYGLVYVCPRAVKSSIVYDDGLPLPANGRNYVDDFSSLFGNMYDTSVRVRNARYVAQKLREDQELKESGCKARITVSCVVHTDGSIEPKIIEDISNYNDAAIKNMDRIIRIAKEAIATLPNVEPALESLHNKHLNKNVHGTREASLSITTKVE